MTKISALPAVTNYVSTDVFALERSSASYKVTAASLRDILASDKPWIVTTKLVDESVASSVTVQTDDELTFVATSGKVYEVEMEIKYTGDAGDLKITIGEDATVRGCFATTSFSSTDVGQTVFLSTTAVSSAIGTVLGAIRSVRVSGIHVGGGGSVTLRWAQNTSSPTATVVKATSWIARREIS